MKLDEYKTTFEKILSKEDYTELEKAINFGLEIEKKKTSQIMDTGSENLQKMVQELPTLHNKLEKLKKERAKQEIEKTFSSYAPSFRRRGVRVYAEAEGALASITGMTFICGALTTHIDTPYFLQTLTIGIVSLAIGINSAIQYSLIDSGRQENYYHPLTLPITATLYASHRLANITNPTRNQKRIDKIEKELEKELKEIYYGNPDYTQKWLKTEVKTLKKLLDWRSEEFKARFLQVEEKLHPLDKLKLRKQIEKSLYKDYYRREKDYLNPQRLLEKIELVEKTGTRLEELKEKLHNHLKYKKEHHKREMGYYEKLAKQCKE